MAIREVNFAVKKCLKLVLHGAQVKECGMGIGSKFHHHIDTAVRPEIVPHNGTIEPEMPDLPFRAEFPDTIRRYRDVTVGYADFRIAVLTLHPFISRPVLPPKKERPLQEELPRYIPLWLPASWFPGNACWMHTK